MQSGPEAKKSLALGNCWAKAGNDFGTRRAAFVGYGSISVRQFSCLPLDVHVCQCHVRHVIVLRNLQGRKRKNWSQNCRDWVGILVSIVRTTCCSSRMKTIKHETNVGWCAYDFLITGQYCECINPPKHTCILRTRY